MRTSRTAERVGFSTVNRVALLEGDADTLEDSMRNLQATLQKILWVLLGVFASGFVSAVLLAVGGVSA